MGGARLSYQTDWDTLRPMWDELSLFNTTVHDVQRDYKYRTWNVLHWLDHHVALLMMIPLYHQHYMDLVADSESHSTEMFTMWIYLLSEINKVKHPYFCLMLFTIVQYFDSAPSRAKRASHRLGELDSGLDWTAVLYPCCARRWSLPHFSFSEWFQLTGPWRDNEQSSLQCSEWGGPVCERETELSHCFSPITRSVEKQQKARWWQ